MVRVAEWCARDGTIGAFDGCTTVVKSSIIPSCTCVLLCELRHLFFGLVLLKSPVTITNGVWMGIFCLPDDVRQLNHSGSCASLRGYIHGSHNYA